VRRAAPKAPGSPRPTVTPGAGRLLARLRGALAAGRPVGLLYLDLDTFKQVNDTAGHPVGDEVLRAVADRLRQVTPTGSLVARLGGDEFGVVVPGDRERVREVAATVAAALAEPFRVQPAGQPPRLVACPASVGVAVPDDTTSGASELLARADLAMYAAKRRGVGQVVGYEPALLADATARAAAAVAVQDAISRDAFTLVFQPVLSLPDGAPVRVEALLRFVGPDGSLHEPGPFLGAVEDAGVSTRLAHTVLRRAVRAARSWQQHLPGLAVAVNLPVAALGPPGGVAAVLDALATADAPASLLVAELQRSQQPGPVPTPQAVAALTEAGVVVLLDDVGRGWTASDLLTLRPHEVGLDRELLAAAADDPTTRGVAAAVVALALAAGADCGAKGVADHQDLDRAWRLGCRRVQGAALAAPVPLAQVPSAVAAAGRAVERWRDECLGS